VTGLTSWLVVQAKGFALFYISKEQSAVSRGENGLKGDGEASVHQLNNSADQ